MESQAGAQILIVGCEDCFTVMGILFGLAHQKFACDLFNILPRTRQPEMVIYTLRKRSQFQNRYHRQIPSKSSAGRATWWRRANFERVSGRTDPLKCTCNSTLGICRTNCSIAALRSFRGNCRLGGGRILHRSTGIKALSDHAPILSRQSSMITTYCLKFW